MNSFLTGGQIDLTDLTQRLAAFVPIPLVRQLQSGHKPRLGRAHEFVAATLFSDMSGFTRMSEELAEDGPRGAEELNRILVSTFDAMVSVIHYFGGAVGHFYGDAMLVMFAEDDAHSAAMRALATAQQMQLLMETSFARVQANRPPAKDNHFQLSQKIGVGYGSCHSAVIGSDPVGYEFVLTGPAVLDATNAEKRASSGQIIASRAALTAAQLPAAANFGAVVEPVSADYFPLTFDTPDSAEACQNLVQCLKPFVPPALVEQLSLSSSVSLAEHRPATSLFVRFQLQHDQTATADEQIAQLNAYYLWAAAMVQRFGAEGGASHRNAHINRVLTGDKGDQLHIIFGAPVAPDAPEQALRCALAMQKERPPYVLTQQIGIVAGKVFAGPLGSRERREYTIVGDVVNLSARLADVCAPGEVLTDKATAERTQDWIVTSALTPIHVKGKHGKITPFRVEQDRTLNTQLQAYFGRWERPLAGRDNEIDTLLGALDVAICGTGSTIGISGEAGVGKTRLLATGVKQWLDGGGVGQVGVCQQHLRDTPFAPWRDIWQRFFGINSSMSTAEQISAVTRRTAVLHPSAEADVALWSEILNLPFPHADHLAGLTAEVRQERFFRLARRCLQAATREQPHLIILEGANWADQSSLDLLDAVSDGIENYALCCILTFRPQKKLTLKLLDRPTAVRIHMGDLTSDQARNMLNALIGTRELSPAAEQHLGLRDRDGRSSPVNPLFLEEALHVMMERGILKINGRVHIDETRLAQLPVPDNIHSILLARLDSLNPSSKGLLQVASVIGRQFALDPLDSITPETPRNLIAQLLQHLTEEALTQIVMSDPEWVYLFHHAMTHEVAYESLPFVRRQALHAAVADWIVGRYGDDLKPFRAMLAYHYGRANIHEEGLRYALEAAHEARNLFANQEAIELYTLAEKHLHVLGIDFLWETAFKIWIERASAFILIGDFTLANVDITRVLELENVRTDPQKLAEATNLQVEILCRQSRYEEARAQVDHILSNFEFVISSDERARLYQWLGVIQSRQLEYEPALMNLALARKISLASGNKRRQARINEGIAFIYLMQGNLQSALNAMREGIELTQQFDIYANLATGYNNISFIESMLGMPESALQSINQAIALARESSRNFLAYFLGSRGTLFAYLGNYDASGADFAEALTILSSMEDEQGHIEVQLQCAYEFHAPQGQWHDAILHYHAVRELLQNQVEPSPEHLGRLGIGMGQYYLAHGEIDQAISELESAWNLLEAKSQQWWKSSCAYFLANAYFLKGNQTEAAAFLQMGLEETTRGSNPDFAGPILISLADLSQNQKAIDDYLNKGLEAASIRIRHSERVQLVQNVEHTLARLTDSFVSHDNEFETLTQRLKQLGKSGKVV